MDKRKKRILIVEIEIKSNEWNYIKGQKIFIPVLAGGFTKAIQRIESNFWGSEYPQYNVINIIECDDFLFKPLI